MEELLKSNQRLIDEDIYTVDYKKSHIILYPDHGVIWLLGSNTIDSGIQYSVEQLKKIKLSKPSIDIYFSDEIIGEIYSAVFKTYNNFLNVFFTTTVNLSDIEPFIVAVPTVSSKRIQCVLCERWLSPSDYPCACLKDSPIIILENPCLESVKFIDSRYNNILEAEVRDNLIKNFFTHSLTKIQTTEPI